MAPNKPSWIDQVKEVDAEEAEVLHALGVDVFLDWEPFYVAPYLQSLDSNGAHRAVLDFGKRKVDFGTGLFYVRRGDDDKR